MRGSNRFSRLEESLEGISRKPLSHRLMALEAANLISRHAYAEIPPRVEYQLTEIGERLASIIDAMREFGEQYDFTP